MKLGERSLVAVDVRVHQGVQSLVILAGGALCGRGGCGHDIGGGRCRLDLKHGERFPGLSVVAIVDWSVQFQGKKRASSRGRGGCRIPLVRGGCARGFTTVQQRVNSCGQPSENGRVVRGLRQQHGSFEVRDQRFGSGLCIAKVHLTALDPQAKQRFDRLAPVDEDLLKLGSISGSRSPTSRARFPRGHPLITPLSSKDSRSCVAVA